MITTFDLAQIEAEVVWSEEPPFHAWEHVADWETYLRLRTMAVLNRPPATTPPNASFGDLATAVDPRPLTKAQRVPAQRSILASRNEFKRVFGIAWQSPLVGFATQSLGATN